MVPGRAPPCSATSALPDEELSPGPTDSARGQEADVTYNFDPERWYENERAALDAELRAGRISPEAHGTALDDLERRLDDMQQRLDGTYRLPSPGKTP